MCKNRHRIGLLLGLLALLSVFSACRSGRGLFFVPCLPAQAASAVPPATGGSSDNAQDDYVMKLGLGGGLCEAATHIAIINGYFKDEGVNYEVINFVGTASLPPCWPRGR